MGNEAQELKKKAEQAKDEAIKRSSRLNKIALDQYSGWKDYIALLDNYAKTMMRNKSITNLSVATKETLDQLKLYDRDVWLINNVIKSLPMRFVNGLEASLKRDKEKEDSNAGTS